jgi:DNA repair protein RadD
VLPTGAKSLVLAALCQELLRDYPALRIGIVTHVRELIAQNYQELMRLWPQAPAGIYSAGIGRRDARAKIVFMGIQSVHNKTDVLGDFDVLLVDECHLIPRNADTSYGRFIARLQDRVPDMRVVGLTATPYRLDSGRLDRGKDRLFRRHHLRGQRRRPDRGRLPLAARLESDRAAAGRLRRQETRRRVRRARAPDRRRPGLDHARGRR